MNISSVIIKTNNVEKCKKTLEKINGVEVAICEGTTIIATIEANDVNEEINIFNKIENAKEVISASMHYSYIEDELKDDLMKMRDITDELNDNSIPINKIKYNGNVNNVMGRKKIYE